MKKKNNSENRNVQKTNDVPDGMQWSYRDGLLWLEKIDERISSSDNEIEALQNSLKPIIETLPSYEAENYVSKFEDISDDQKQTRQMLAGFIHRYENDQKKGQIMDWIYFIAGIVLGIVIQVLLG